jgi:cyanate permease
MVGVDVLYTAMLTYLAYLISTYTVKSSTAHFRWNTLLLSILLPALLLLIAFTIYNVRRDKQYKNKEVKHG